MTYRDLKNQLTALPEHQQDQLVFVDTGDTLEQVTGIVPLSEVEIDSEYVPDGTPASQLILVTL